MDLVGSGTYYCIPCCRLAEKWRTLEAKADWDAISELGKEKRDKMEIGFG